MTISQTDVMIAALLETLNQVRGLLRQPAFLSPDASEVIADALVRADALALIDLVYQLPSVQRWLATGSTDMPGG